jgi:transposase
LIQIIGLPGWTAVERSENGHDMLISAEFTTAPQFCPRCGVVSPRLKKYGVQPQTFMDTPMHGKRVAIGISRQRYKCLECDKTFQQLLPDMDEKRTMTRRLLEYIQRRSLERTFTEVAADVGVNEKTVRNIFNEFVGELDAKYWPLAPDWLGIDELFLVGKPRCIFTNVQQRTVLDLLPNRDKASVTQWLQRNPLHILVQVVTMDMWKPYRDAVNAVMPDSTVVVDKFHVVKMANHALDSIRKELREGMDLKQRRKLLRSRHLILRRRKDLNDADFAAMQEWTDAIPALFHAYQAKEDFFDIYDCTSRGDAEELYDIWKATLDKKTMLAFHELIRAVDNWRPEIFNYFDHRATNAFTEAANGMAKVANRMGRGYSFEAIRAKILFGQAKHIKRPKFGETELTATDDLGVSLPSLIELLDANHSDTLNSE